MATIKLDQVSAVVLVGDRPIKQYTASAKDNFLAGINAFNVVSFTFNDIELGVPTTLSNDDNYNSAIVLTAKPNRGISGSQTVKYNRAPLADIVYNRNLDNFKYDKVSTRTRQMLATFNIMFGTAIDPLEIVDEDIVLDGPTVFRASSDSFSFVPGSEVNMGVLAPSARDWELVGLEWPDMAPTYTYGLDFSSLSASLEALAASGSLTNTMADSLCTTANSLRGDNFFVAGYNSYRADGLPGGLRATTFVKVALPNTTYATNNSGKFNRALVVFPQTSAWFKDPLVFHYNA